jgi:hypothetical protein|nr:MAG: hypothetical protein [Bacteriophage sp.]
MKTVVLLSKVFFEGHPKEGQPTDFAQSVKDGCKRHTVRSNYVYWEKKIAALKKQGGTLCIRQWSGKPYRSQQETILEVPASVVGIQKVAIVQTGVSQLSVQVDGCEVPISEIARNDGLNSVEFTEFLRPILKNSEGNETTFAVIHFTDFRY